MSNHKIISDMHFGHINITKFRPQFNSSKEHDEFILNNIIKNLHKRDTLWILGDCFFSRDAYYMFFDNVFCHKINWIIGNHDTDNGIRQENVKIFCKEKHPRFGKIGSLFKYGKFWLSHHPIHPMELRGKRNIHGHTHYELMRKEDETLDDRYINVCCEHTEFSLLTFNKNEIVK